MKRNAIDKLKSWIEGDRNIPALLTGFRGVGKTYLALEFARAFSKNYIYINFETSAVAREFFRSYYYDVNKQRSIINALCDYLEITEDICNTSLFILDELCCCEEAVNLVLQSGQELTSDTRVLILSGTEIEQYKECSMDFYRVRLRPLSFDEFLLASGHEWYKEVIQAHYMNMRKIPDIMHNELLSYFESYSMLGGMPSVLMEYFSTESELNIIDRQLSVYNCIFADVDKYYSDSEALKQKQVLDILDSQQLKSNKKFQFILLRRGASYNMYKEAFSKLKQSGLIITSKRIMSDECLDIDKTDDSVFRTYYSDLGILNLKLNICDKNLHIDEYMRNKAVINAYVAQELTASERIFAFWESNSQAKVDFIIKNNDGLIPADVRNDEYKRSKSMLVFNKLYDIPYSFRISYKNFEYKNKTKYIPLYATFCI